MEELDTRERLLLAQAVYEYGNQAWDQVSQLLINHPLLVQTSTDVKKFTPQRCTEWYDSLMQSENLQA
jgi:bromodomain-containing protein 8